MKWEWILPDAHTNIPRAVFPLSAFYTPQNKTMRWPIKETDVDLKNDWQNIQRRGAGFMIGKEMFLYF